MGLQETRIESLPFVTAELNYLAPVSGKPRTYAFDPPPGEPKSTSLPEAHQVPRLVEVSDIRGVFHCHTRASDGGNTLEEMAEAARALGLKYLGIGDHSQSLTVANGLSVERVRRD